MGFTSSTGILLITYNKSNAFYEMTRAILALPVKNLANLGADVEIVQDGKRRVFASNAQRESR